MMNKKESRHSHSGIAAVGLGNRTNDSLPPATTSKSHPAVSNRSRKSSYRDEESIQDFQRLLEVLGKSHLNEMELSGLLASIGCAHIKSHDLLDELSAFMPQTIDQQDHDDTAGEQGLKTIDTDYLQCLYDEPSYSVCADRRQTGLALMQYLQSCFRKAGAAGEETKKLLRGIRSSKKEAKMPLQRGNWGSKNETNSIFSSSLTTMDSVHEDGPTRTFIEHITGVKKIHRRPSGKKGGARRSQLRHNGGKSAPNYAMSKRSLTLASQELATLVRWGDDNEEGSSDALENVATAILRLDKSETLVGRYQQQRMGLREAAFDPAHCSNDKFVASLDKTVLQHQAIHHHLLDSISKGSFGEMRTIQIVAQFLQAYRYFTSNFTSLLGDCLDFVGEINEEFKEVLMENMEEEQGNYDEKTMAEIWALGLDATKLKGLPHKELYLQCMETIAKVSGATPLKDDDVARIASPMLAAFEAACSPYCSSSTSSSSSSSTSSSDKGRKNAAAKSIAAMYFGSELLVSTLYRKLSQYLLLSDKLTNQDLAFFALHMDMDVEHAAKIRGIVVQLADDEIIRREMVGCVERILNGRVEFYDRLIDTIFLPTGHSGVETGALYNKQSHNWVRKKAACLSDFTGRPVVFEMCQEHVKDAFVLDLGCGEGYGARKLIEMGASRVTGLDVSDEMVGRARQNASSSSKEVYITGDASKLVNIICERPAYLGITPGRSMVDDGVFDLAVAIFLFNSYIHRFLVFSLISIMKMKEIIQQVFQVLTPGGTFVFSVPHPFMLNAHGIKDSASSKKTGDLRGEKYARYPATASQKDSSGNRGRDRKIHHDIARKPALSLKARLVKKFRNLRICRRNSGIVAQRDNEEQVHAKNQFDDNTSMDGDSFDECIIGHASSPASPRKQSAFSFSRGDTTADSYFSLRDRKFAGVIHTIDGRALNVKMCFKSISDYIDAVLDAGFEISCMHEARVMPEHVATNPDFFESVKDSPLHIIFKVKKPMRKATDLGMIPRRIISRSAFERAHAKKKLELHLPEDVSIELESLVNDLANKGITSESYNLSTPDLSRLTKVMAFANEIRDVIYRRVAIGAALVSRLRVDNFKARPEDAQPDTERLKLAYYIICSLVGKVDGSARGRLFDVKDRRLDSKSDNVLFSVTNGPAGWHTDGASADRKYDIVSLLCIAPAAEGGTFRVSDAVSAFQKLKKTLPKFLLNELLHPIPRDVLENGKGQGVSEVLMRVSRVEEILKLRVRHNSYPIFVEDKGSLQFRYMRYWIETGHKKAGLPLSPFLRIAMDALDAALDEEEIFAKRLEPGEMVFCNNLQMAHARDAFVDHKAESGGPQRHMVRAWIQAQDLEEETW